jgi:hypothetical protein
MKYYISFITPSLLNILSQQQVENDEPVGKPCYGSCNNLHAAFMGLSAPEIPE